MSGGPEDASDFTQEYGVYEQAHPHEFDAHEASIREKRARTAQAEDVPDGAEVFGGDTAEDERPTDSPSEGDEQAAATDPVALRDRARKRKKRGKITDMAQAQEDDRSGIPTRTLPANMVDEKGNPILPGGAPDTSMDDEEEDPGEIGQI
jgi:hypothetical protein